MIDSTPDEIQAVIAKLGAGRWEGFTERELEVAEWIVGWSDIGIYTEDMGDETTRLPSGGAGVAARDQERTGG